MAQRPTGALNLFCKWVENYRSGTHSLLEELGLTIVPFSVEQAECTAQLWKSSNQFGLSLAERACLGLAIARKSTVLTADRVWVKLNLNIEIRLLR